MLKIANTILAVLVVSCGVHAQQATDPDSYDAEQLAEIERQAQFRTGFEAIVADLNDGSFERFTSAINREDMLERIFGLRLIDQRVKKGFGEDFETNFPDIIERQFIVAKDHSVRAHLLGFDSRGNIGRATVRYDLPDFQYSYHEYDLRLSEKGDVYIADWIDFLRGETFSESVGEMLVAAAPSKQAVRKLIDLPRPSESQVFQVTEMLKSVRDRRPDRFLEIYGALNEALKAQRITVISHAHLMKDTRKRRELRTALIAMSKYFPNEPKYSLMLLDYYFPSRRYEDALGALERLQARLGVEDSAMKARLSAASLVLQKTDDAVTYASRAVEMEPELELGWWSAARANVVAGDAEQTVLALTQLEDRFGHSLGPDALQKDPLFRELLKTTEYKTWSAGRHQ